MRSKNWDWTLACQDSGKGGSVVAKAKSWEEYKTECEAVAKEGITVLGFVAPWGESKTKLICQCDKHGEWRSTSINNFKKRGSCPSCSKMVHRTADWEIYKAECELIAKEEITILGFVEPWQGARTKLICHCEKHGKWETTSISSFKRGYSCPKCKNEKASVRGKTQLTGNQYGLKEDSFHTKEFMKTGSFHPEAQFFRSEKLDSGGRKSYWNYTCPVCSNDEYVKAGVCSGVFEGITGDLKSGKQPCRCSKWYRYTKEQWEYRLKKECKEKGYEFFGWNSEKFGNSAKFIYLCPLHGEQSIIPNSFLNGHGCPQCAGRNQQECYINIVYDQITPIALKFGIANNSEVRLRQQNKKNLFRMKQVQVYHFNSVDKCKASEQACLRELECGILTARELKDGWTETTSIQNLDKIIEIYERFGGVRVK